MTRSPPLPASPFKGLASFEDSALDAMLFFGREREREVITANLLASRLTVLYGPSGVGKSSLLRAGVAHQLLKLDRENVESGRARELAVVVFGSWSGDVVAELRAAVEAELFGGAGSSPSDRPLADDLAAWTQELGLDLYLILDQAEEYFVYHGVVGDEHSFVRQFPELLRPSLRVNCLLALREEALATLDVFKAQLPNLLSNRLRLERLDREAGRAAIVGPVRVYNELAAPDERVEVEPALVDAVLGQVEAGMLDHRQAGRGRTAEAAPAETIEAPYLQLVMQRLWEVEQASGSGALTLDTLSRLGGAQQVVEDHLERALRALTPPEQDAAAGMFRYLVTPSGTKIAHGVSDLRKYASVSEPELDNVLKRLSAERILRPVSGAGNGSGRYEIFHDVLADAVLAWRGGRELEAARQDAERRHRRALTVAGVSLVALAVMAAITVFALTQRSSARAQARKARAGELAAAALSELSFDPQHSLGLALEAAGLERSSGAEDALRQSLLASRERGVLHTGGPVSTAMFDPQGKTTLIGSADGIARLHDAATGRLLHRLKAGGPVDAASFGRGGRLVATGSERGAVRLWDARSGRLLHAWQTGGAVGSTSFNREGTLLLAASADGTTRIWRVGDGSRTRLLRQNKPVLAGSFSPDGRLVLTVTPGAAWLFDARSGQLLHPLRRGNGPRRPKLLSASFSPNGKLVVTTSEARTALLWDVASGDVAFKLRGHLGQVTDAAFSPHGTLVVTASTDEAGRVWDTRTGDLVAVLPAHTNRLTDASFSPDGTWVVTASRDRTARLFRARSGGLMGVLAGHRDTVVEASFSPDGNRVITASADGTARLWDPGTSPELRKLGSHGAPLTSAAFSPDGRLAVSAGADGTARVRRVPGGRVMLVVQHRARVTSASFDSAGRRVLTTSLDRTARISPLREPSRARVLRAGARVLGGSFSPDGKLVVTVGGGRARLWTARDGAPLRALRHPGVVTAAFSPDGARVVTASSDGTARLWSTAGGPPAHVLRGHDGAIVSAVFSPDGWLVLTAGHDASARLWDARTGAIVHVLRGHTKPLTSAAFSPDGRLVATTSRDNDGRVWSVASGRPLFVLRGHNSVVNQVRFSEDGRWLVTAGPQTAGLWPVTTGRILLFLRGHVARLTSASFDAGGSRVLTSSDDGTVRLYRCEICAPIDRLVALARQRLAALAR